MSDDETKPQMEESADKVEEKEEVQENKPEEETETKEEPPKEEKVEDDTTKVEEEEEEEEEKKVEAKEEKEETKQETPVKETPETPPKEDVRPLYDQPLEMSGKRDRKKVERFVQETKKEEPEASGKGAALGDIPYINAMIMKMQVDDLKVLHRVAYSRPGSGNEVKKNLRKFNGFPFTKEDKKYNLKLSNVERILMSEIKKMLLILGLERAGNKGEVVERLMDFMLNPEDRGRKPPKVTKTKGRGRPKKGTQGKKKKNNTSLESVKSGESESEDSDESGEEEVEEEEEEEEKPKKTQKKTPAKKPQAKRVTSAKKATPAKRSKAVASADSDSDSDDEPLAKKVKQPPSDLELKAMVKKILDGANLEEITMKSVCRQVYDNYPDFDLTHKKDFIKETVKSIIS
ncbi:protein DEK-like [Penaeus japonicus]|uniref:protein DEK-like n=1 Tax=Penaeus japonicus TaxID=27405 RepID=UPI001C714DA2|nr:protein DEK-like [Penaeus japonicus]